MSGRLCKLCVLLLTLLLLSACGAIQAAFGFNNNDYNDYYNGEEEPPPQARGRLGFDEAVEEGIIAQFDDTLPAVVRHETVYVTKRDVTIMYEVGAVINITNISRPTFRGSSGHITVHVEAGERVREGDLLAVLVPLPCDDTNLRRVRAERDLNQFNREFLDDQHRHLTNIQRAEENLNIAPSGEWERAALQLAQLRYNYNRFLFDRGERRTVLENALESIVERITGERLYAPIDGLVTHTVPEGTEVFSTGHPQVATILDDENFHFQINLSESDVASLRLPSVVDPTALIRFGDVLHVRSDWTRENEDGEEEPVIEFFGRIVTDPFVHQTRNLWYIMLPVDLEGFLADVRAAGMTMDELRLSDFTVSIPVDFIHGGIMLPREAVNDEYHWRFVIVYDEGGFLKRYVSTGITHEGYVHIIYGLEEGTEVVIMP